MPLKWRKTLIADERYESAGIFDVNNDGVLDIVSGAWWYEGPDFKKKHRIGDIRIDGDYFDDFSTIPLDINGDGYMDYITGGWGWKTLRWRENSGDPDKQWPEHDILECGCIESTRAWDIDGDGVIEVVPNTPGAPLRIYKLVTGKNGKGTGKFSIHTVFEEEQGHGLGCGDIAGNGRRDFVLSKGWLEAPKNPFEGKWIWHPDFELGPASVPILVVDVNGDGLNDLIVGQAHNYGLDWWEQRVKGGKRAWVKHPIDPFNSQYHDMLWLDIDADGQYELVTGKRYRAHGDGDPGSDDDVGIYYFKWNGENFSKQIIDYGTRGLGRGCGIHFAAADLTGNGLPDIVAPGKNGLYLYTNLGF